MLSGAREAGCFREVAVLHSDHLRQVPLYYGGRPDFKYIHGHYASLVVFRKKLQTASEITIAP